MIVLVYLLGQQNTFLFLYYSELPIASASNAISFDAQLYLQKQTQKDAAFPRHWQHSRHNRRRPNVCFWTYEQRCTENHVAKPIILGATSHLVLFPRGITAHTNKVLT